MGNSAILDRIGDRRIVASVSGGKDSAAARLYLREMGIPDEQIDNVAMDTGWEADGWRAYVDGPLTDAIGPVTVIRAEVKRLDLIDVTALRPRVRAAVEAGSAMVQAILRKGMFPSKRRRFCTQELKVFPMQRHLTALVDAGHEGINLVGIRRAESAARADMAEWEWSEGFDCEVWRPLVEWTEAEVIAIHQRHGLAPNPLYLRGASRVGCWPCIYARKSEIRMIADRDPERIALIRDLEHDVREAAERRAAAKGTTMEAQGFSAPAFFQATIGDSGDCWPIDRVVEWSRTVHGGKHEDKQENLFAGMNDGCMRWGLCETTTDTAGQGDPVNV